ncbi:hypothetical protein [Natronogracilivirga saccharolytica]|uniref:Uncharacterized protein n=1 Tax=Natronogracilivirga saccharolytica TaxID=2812953 RepID=A0A8J7UTS3_9BACT|nr:hypothetical protein [Natronogracilivirga saccharolytica]MBP3192876.1 hypothetical protein [Natronogracilivirga saccharolytica]
MSTYPSSQERQSDAALSVADAGFICTPFELVINPMERLLLINIENDPDSLYIGFEPQVFDDEINGSGILVIAWRTDGRVDVYHQPQLQPDPARYDIAGKGLAHMIEHPLEGAYLEVDDRGAQTWFAFEDIDGRPVEVTVSEAHPARRKPFGLLAPMGDAAESPSAMPLVLLHDFYFVRRSHTRISVRIGGRHHRPDTLPMPLDFRRMYFARYSADPLIVTMNPAFNGKLNPLKVSDNGYANTGDTRYELIQAGGKTGIKSISRCHKHHKVSLNFTPAFPDVLSLADSTESGGDFEIHGHPSTGKVGGVYTVGKRDGVTRISMTPSRGWIPNESKWSLRFLYTVGKVFKSWPKTYTWTATLTSDKSGQLQMVSAWQRK